MLIIRLVLTGFLLGIGIYLGFLFVRAMIVWIRR